MLTWGSHRPERARLTHSVPQVTPSLRQRRTVASNPLGAIRWPCVDTPWQARASRVFPSSGVVTRRPASLHRVQDGASSPASTVLSGRYDFPPPVSPRFVSFAQAIPPERSCFARRAAERRRAPSLLELVTRYLQPGCCRWRRQDLLRSWGTPSVLLPCSPTPAGPTHQAITMRRRGPRCVHDEGSRVRTFEAQSHGFGTGCLRFAVQVTHTPRKTRFRLLAKLFRTGLITRRVPSKGFKLYPTSILLSQVQRSARTFYFSTILAMACYLSCEK